VNHYEETWEKTKNRLQSVNLKVRLSGIGWRFSLIPWARVSWGVSRAKALVSQGIRFGTRTGKLEASFPDYAVELSC
jgi:hypothetical protein